MTIGLGLELRCDCCIEGRLYIPRTLYQGDFGTARRVAREKGWQTFLQDSGATGDICPECVAQQRRERQRQRLDKVLRDEGWMPAQPEGA